MVVMTCAFLFGPRASVIDLYIAHIIFTLNLMGLKHQDDHTEKLLDQFQWNLHSSLSGLYRVLNFYINLGISNFKGYRCLSLSCKCANKLKELWY